MFPHAMEILSKIQGFHVGIRASIIVFPHTTEIQSEIHAWIRTYIIEFPHTMEILSEIHNFQQVSFMKTQLLVSTCTSMWEFAWKYITFHSASCCADNAIKQLQLNTSKNGWSNQHTPTFFCFSVVCLFVSEFELTRVDTCTEIPYAHVLVTTVCIVPH